MFRAGKMIKIGKDINNIAVDFFDFKGWFPKYLFDWLLSLGMTKNFDRMENLFRELTKE